MTSERTLSSAVSRAIRELHNEATISATTVTERVLQSLPAVA